MSQPPNTLEVSIVTPQAILFQGQASSVSLPGAKGKFEVLINHKPLLSLLFPGEIVVDQRSVPVRRGIVKVIHNKVFAIVEEVSN